MTNTPHGQVPEALIDLIDAYAETRHRCGGVYNGKTEAARKAVIEALSGVQALSAAPADVEDAIAWLVTWKGGEHTYVHAHASELPAVTQARVMGGTVTPCVAALAASPTPTAEQQAQPGAVGRTGCTAGTDEECTRRGCATSCPDQQAAQVIINFPQVGTAGPFPVVDGRVSLPDSTMQDLVRMLRPTYEAEQQAQPGAVYAELPAPTASIGTDDAWHEAAMRDFADRTHALRMEQAAPKAAPGVGNSGFDHKTAADFLNGKTVSDEAVRKFVATSRWAHDERAALSATLLAMHGVLTSREAEIALLKQALLEAEAAPQPAPAPLSDDTKRLDWLDRNIFSREMSEWDAKYGHGPDYNMWVVFSPKGVQGSARNVIDAAIAAQGGKV